MLSSKDAHVIKHILKSKYFLTRFPDNTFNSTLTRWMYYPTYAGVISLISHKATWFSSQNLRAVNLTMKQMISHVHLLLKSIPY